MPRTPQLSLDCHHHQLVDAVFVDLALRGGRTHVQESSWRTDVALRPEALEAVASSTSAGGQVACVLELGQALAVVRVGRGEAHVRIAADHPSRLAAAERELREQLPVVASDDREVAVTLWYRGTYGDVERETKRLSVPSWEDVAVNYPVATRRQLAPLVAAAREDLHGRLLLWHGPPGTGKTYALRALAHAWRRWCAVHYIVDPEVLFGEEPGYLAAVLTGDQDDRAQQRLLVLEDTGELLSADAGERAGQGLSRLLNLVDGILGDGSGIYVLVTTNEEVRGLHEAVARPGRCAHRAHFAPFPADEAAMWMERRGGRQLAAPHTLAELYALSRGVGLGSRRGRELGFA